MGETGNKVATKQGIHIDKLQKLAVMEMFRQNDWNISKTSRESGVNRRTLARWINGDETIIKPRFAKKIVKEVVANTHQSIDVKIRAVVTPEQLAQGIKNLSDHIATSMYLRDLALKRMIELINSETDMDKITKLITALSKYLDPVEGPKTHADSPITAIVNNIQANFVGNEEMKLFIAEKLSQLKDNQ